MIDIAKTDTFQTAPSNSWDSVAENYDEFTQLHPLKKWFFIFQNKVIFKFLSIKKGELVLDAGCGTGFYGRKCQKLGGNVVYFDFSEKMLNVLKNKLNGNKKKIIVRGDILAPPFKNNVFNKIVCHGVMVSFPKKEGIQKSLKRLHALLKTKGTLVFDVSLTHIFYKINLIYNRIKYKSLKRLPFYKKDKKTRGYYNDKEFIEIIKTVFNEFESEKSSLGMFRIFKVWK